MTTEPSSLPLDPRFWLDGRWMRSTGRAAIALFAGTALTFIASLLAARALGPESYGSVVLATSVVASIAVFLDFSLEEAVVHFGTKSLAERDVAGTIGLLVTSLRLDVVVGAVVFLGIALGSSWIADAATSGHLEVSFVRLAALEALAITTNGTTGAALLIAGRPELRARAAAFGGLLRLLSVAVALAISPTVWAVLCAYVIGSALGAVGQAMLAVQQMRRAWGRVKPGPTRVSTKRLATFGANSSLTTTLDAIRFGAIAVILGRQAGPSVVGFLNIAMLPIVVVGIATAPLRMTTFPEQARLSAEGRLDVLWRGLRTYTLVGGAVAVAGAVAGWFLLPTMIRVLFSAAYLPSVSPARILLIAAVATMSVAWAKALPAAVGRPGVRTIVSLVELVLTVGGVLVFADRGVEGAATAISIATVVVALIWFVVARRMLTRSQPAVSGPLSSAQDD
jgi:O-antigen/teichoic acid export membrane protein